MLVLAKRINEKYINAEWSLVSRRRFKTQEAADSYRSKLSHKKTIFILNEDAYRIYNPFKGEKLSIKKQISHIKKHQDLFDKAYSPNPFTHRDVEEYFKNYHDSEKEEGSHLYLSICSDIGIEPLKGVPE